MKMPHPNEDDMDRVSSSSLSDLESSNASTSSTSSTRHSGWNNRNDQIRPSARNASTNGSATGVGLTRTVSRRESILSRVRSRPIPQFTHPLSHVKTTEDQLVDYDGPDDPYLPMNWPTKKKVFTTLLYGLVTMTATWASSAYSAGTRQIAEHFNVGNQVSVLGTTLYLLGFGVGPLLWAPLSEVFGRRLAVLVPMFIAISFSFGSATAKDFQTLMLTRFFGAFFASAPVTNTGGVLGDLFSPSERGIAMAGYAMAVVGGPVLGKHCLFQLASLLLLIHTRTYRLGCSCPRAIARVALDRIYHRHPPSIHLDHSLHLHRRKLPTASPCVQGSSTASRNRQLGFACKIRRMGCKCQRISQQIPCPTYSVAVYAHLFPRRVVRQLLLRHLVHATRCNPHHLWRTQRLGNVGLGVTFSLHPHWSYSWMRGKHL